MRISIRSMLFSRTMCVVALKYSKIASQPVKKFRAQRTRKRSGADLFEVSAHGAGNAREIAGVPIHRRQRAQNNYIPCSRIACADKAEWHVKTYF